jgi:hypothetical protein
VFSEGLREAVLERGQSLSREELDMNLKSDQTLLEKVAGEYNRINVDECDAIQFPQFAHKLCSNNFPYKFSPIDWTDAKKLGISV